MPTALSERSQRRRTLREDAFNLPNLLTMVRIVVLSSPQSIDQFPRAIAEEANNFTTNMLTTAKNSANNAYPSNRHGR